LTFGWTHIVKLLWEERVDVYMMGAKTFMARLRYVFKK